MSFHKNILFSWSFLPAKICCINFTAIPGSPSSKYEHRSTGHLWPFYRQKTSDRPVDHTGET